MNTEPSTIIGTITGLAAALLAALIAFGVNFSQDQQDALLGLIAVAAPIIAGIVIRGQVYAPKTVEGEKFDSYQAGLHDANPNVPPSERRI